MLTAANESTKKAQEVLATAGGALHVEEQSPAHEQGDVFTFEADKSLTAGESAVALAFLLPADTIKQFTPVLLGKRAAAGSATTITYAFKHSVDGGTNWATIYDSAGSALSFTLAPSGATYEGKSLPPIEVTGGLVACYVSCITNNAVVTVYGGWVP
jgi:hypothetical protein